MRKVDMIFNSMVGKGNTEHYTLYDYLESDGNGQYIDTGMPATDNTSISLDISLTNRDTQIYIGNSVASNRTFTFRQSYSGPVFDIDIDGVIQRLPDLRAPGFKYGEWNSLTIGKNIHLVHSNGTEYDYVLTPSEFTTDGNIYLFANNGISGAERFAKCRMKQVERHDSGVLTQLLHPAVRDSDGVAGMLDMVNNVFHANANPAGDNFLYGNLT